MRIWLLLFVLHVVNEKRFSVFEYFKDPF